MAAELLSVVLQKTKLIKLIPLKNTFVLKH